MKLNIIALLLWVNSAGGAFNVYHFDDAEQQARFDRLIVSLRCPTCQNNNLADSNALLATDIKAYIYRAVQDGRSERDITDYLISRYGEFISYQPRSPWIGVLPLAIGGIALLISIGVIARQRRRRVLPAPDTATRMDAGLQ